MNDDSTSRLVAGLTAWVSSASAGAQVPSSRSLVREYSVSPITVQKAMRVLIGQGLVESRPGVGTFVLPRRQAGVVDFGWQTAALGPTTGVKLSVTQRTPGPDAIALHSGYPGRELLPEGLVRKALTRAARSEVAIARSPAAGVPALQEWFSGQLVGASPRDVVITSGSQGALSSVFRALVGQGQPLVIESPTYWGAILAARQCGVRLVPVASGSNGPDPDDVARALLQSGARAFYAQPTFANPTGAQWSTATGAAVLEVVREQGAFLIEDDWAHDLGIDSEPRPLARLDQAGHVVYLRSLTKSVSPAIRVAAVIARGPARDRILADRAAEAVYVSGVLQAAALDVVTQPAWQTHLRALHRHLRERRDALIAALTTHVPRAHVEVVPMGGLNLWLRLPESSDPGQFVSECEREGLILAAGNEWFPAEPTGPFVRLNFGAETPQRLDEAARILGRVL
jgi:DNA-binding transcriptional MocR family regulator